MRNLHIIFTSALALVVMGCAHNPVPLSGAAPVPNKKEKATPVADINKAIGDANVVFVRRYAQPTAYPISIRVNDVKVASLSQRKFSAVKLPPGKYQVTAKWPIIAGQRSINLDIEVKDNTPQYFEFIGESDFTKSFGLYTKGRQLKPHRGAGYIAKCCAYKEPKKREPFK